MSKPTGRKPRPAIDRIMNLSRETGAGCWEYAPDSRADRNYRQVYLRRGVRRYAHRVVYEHMVGDIPAGLQLDHLCRNRICVNPAHLEPVTAQVNTRRARPVPTHCPQGHAYDEENTGTSPTGIRWCRTCKRVKALARYYANKNKES